jgi:hypothetical protein
MAIFQIFPKGRKEWLRATLFLFQAFVFAGHFEYRYFFYSLPRGYRGELDNLSCDMLLGYAVCFLCFCSLGLGKYSKVTAWPDCSISGSQSQQSGLRIHYNSLLRKFKLVPTKQIPPLTTRLRFQYKSVLSFRPFGMNQI